MDKKITIAILAVVCLISLSANYYLFSDRNALLNELEEASRRQPAAVPVKPTTKKLASSADGARQEDIAELNEYISQLQNQLSSKQDQLSEVQRREDERMQGRMRENRQEREARMREEEPERYQEMVQRREEARQAFIDSSNATIEYLKGIDTRNLNADQAKAMSAYQSLLEERLQMFSNIDDDNPPDFRRGGEIMRELMNLRPQIQEILFSQIGDGRYTDEIMRAVEITSNGPGPGRGPRP